MLNDNVVSNDVFEDIFSKSDSQKITVTELQSHNWIPYPKGIIRFLARLPLVGYRMGLGDTLNAAHLMVLTTRGRHSGKPRHTPIEYRRHGKKVYLVSAWGKRPHWYQNILAEPTVTVQLGGKVFQARSRQITDTAEALRALYLFRRIAPARYDAVLSRLIESDVNAHTLPDQSSQFTVVRLDLTHETPELPGIPMNLAWIVPVVIFGMIGGSLIFGVAKLRRSE